MESSIFHRKMSAILQTKVKMLTHLVLHYMRQRQMEPLLRQISHRDSLTIQKTVLRLEILYPFIMASDRMKEHWIHQMKRTVILHISRLQPEMEIVILIRMLRRKMSSLNRMFFQSLQMQTRMKQMIRLQLIILIWISLLMYMRILISTVRQQ